MHKGRNKKLIGIPDRKPEGKRPIERPRRRLDDCIKTGFKN
jgi:hypothetical protein